MDKHFVKTQHNESVLNPNGLGTLKLVLEKTDNNSFYRQKITGGLEFIGGDFKNVLHMEQRCCEDVLLTLYRNCNSLAGVFARTKFKTNKIEWDFDLCTAKVPAIDIIDLYLGVYKFWETKVNMCAIPKTEKVKYTYRKEVSDKVSNYIEIVNECGNYFADWVFWCIKKTFTGTEYEGIIPVDSASMSKFLFEAFNPCTGKRNSLAFAIVAQASDFMNPTEPRATGITNLGILSDSLALPLKDLLETLDNTFDLKWYINENGKFGIEHISYFENNLSYEANSNFGIDLSNPKYEKYLKGYSYSYKNDDSDFYGIEELKLTLNEAMFKSDRAIEGFLDTSPNGTELFQDSYFFSKVTDFELGNIKFLEGCIPYDEKGQVKKKTRASSLFMTAIEPVRLVDPTADKTKWVLLDCKKESEFSLIHVIVDSNCERLSVRMPNGNFTATSIMRDFLRYKKPFSVGLMGYSDKPNGNIGKGYNRVMYSVITSQKMKKVSIPYCCEDLVINPNLKIKLPNGTFATLEKAEYEFSTEMINLEFSKISSCSNSIIFPDLQSGNNYPVKGTILKIETVQVQVSFENICTDEGCYPQPIYADVTRTTYADGEGGSYFEDV